MSLLRVETHCHSEVSGDCLMQPARMVEICRARQIDRLCITDHNSMSAVSRLQALAPQLVIPGEEIMTTQGELLGYYMTEAIPANLPPLEVIARLRAQGAAISVSHPFDTHRKGHWQLEHLLEILPLVDAIETFNARCFRPSFNTQAQTLAAQHGIAGTAGSDAHSYGEIGQTLLQMPEFHNGESFARALRQAQPLTHLSPAWVHLTSRWAALTKKFHKPAR